MVHRSIRFFVAVIRSYRCVDCNFIRFSLSDIDKRIIPEGGIVH